MPYPIESKLVIAVSSSALFDMLEANDVFVAKGEDAYRAYQLEHLEKPFERGVAYPFIKRLLRLNTIYPKEQPIEIVVLSKNDPETGRRFFRSCQHYEMDITRGAFVTGKSPHPYITSFNASLFLSSNKQDVDLAVQKNLPAGLVRPTVANDEDESTELRIAFDFDGVIADDQSEKVFQESKSLDLYHESEMKRLLEPHNPGPLKDLITKISFFQKLELKKQKQDKNYAPALRIAIVTARNAPSNERFVTTLKQWNITADETFFLGGIEKKRVLDVLKPHIFFDDQMNHLQPACSTVPSVHIPFGTMNLKPIPADAKTIATS